MLLVVAIIYGCTQINFLFKPLATFVSTLFVPFIIAGFLYYLLNPIVKLLMKVKLGKVRLSRTLAVAIVFLLLIGIIAMLLSYLIPHFIVQVEQLLAAVPNYITSLQKSLTELTDKLDHSQFTSQINVQKYIAQVQNNATNAVKQFLMSLLNSYDTIISMITSISVTIITVPFLLFYMLKDGHKLLPMIKRQLPEKKADETILLLQKMDKTISRYISGQMIECLFVGTFSGLGYSLVGLPYALLIGISAGFANIIPYIGPYIGLVPALILALSLGINKVILVVVICLVVQQVDGNFIYPNVIGKSLDIHPVTIIVLMLASGNIAGLVGMILVIPTYAVVKVIILHIVSIIKIRYKEGEELTNQASSKKSTK